MHRNNTTGSATANNKKRERSKPRNRLGGPEGKFIEEQAYKFLFAKPQDDSKRAKQEAPVTPVPPPIVRYLHNIRDTIAYKAKQEEQALDIANDSEATPEVTASTATFFAQQTKQTLPPPSPLHLAVEREDIHEVTRLLSESNEAINQFDATNRSPLIIAVEKQNPEMVRLLVNACATVYLRAPGVEGKSPLEMVKRSNNNSSKREEMAIIILSAYADLSISKHLQTLINTWDLPAVVPPPELPTFTM